MNFDWQNESVRRESLNSRDITGAKIVRDLQDAGADRLREALSDLIELQNSADRRRRLPKPRVFISHRHADEMRARVFERRIRKGGKFFTWLDVLDPHLIWITKNPNADSERHSLAIAIQIELALLNCTHVLAIVTQHSAGSLWIPYEYGRVKCSTMFSQSAAAWMRHSIYAGNNFADYFRLGTIWKNREEVNDWIDEEWQRWSSSMSSGSPPACWP